MRRIQAHITVGRRVPGTGDPRCKIDARGDAWYVESRGSLYDLLVAPPRPTGELPPDAVPLAPANLSRSGGASTPALVAGPGGSLRARVVKDLADARVFIAETGYPVVAKPDAGVGALDTFRLENDADLDAIKAALAEKEAAEKQSAAESAEQSEPPAETQAPAEDVAPAEDAAPAESDEPTEEKKEE